MAGVSTRARVGVTRAEREAEAAWERYASTCRMGGTDIQRRRAYADARKRQDRLDRVMAAERAGR